MSKKMKRPKLGEKIVIDYGQDANGRWWWRESRDLETTHGPFATERDAEDDSRRAVFGSGCEIKDAGRWDPAWDKKQ
jgi:hypothetical protein